MLLLTDEQNKRDALANKHSKMSEEERRWL